MDSNFSKRIGDIITIDKSIINSFLPKNLFHKITYSDRVVGLMAKASSSISKLETIGKKIENPHLLIMPYLKKEAVLSSKIEGTRTTMDEVLMAEDLDEIPNDDIEEVLNYVKALELIISKKDLPLTKEIILETHKILLSGVRGSSKNPGEFKTSPNFTGTTNDILTADFVFTPPSYVAQKLDNFLEVLNNLEEYPSLLAIAQMHYQFEVIHPFRDGNGRLGRVLISYYLLKYNLLSNPVLYLSAYFEKYNVAYKQKLFDVSFRGELEEWVEFFLKGVELIANETSNRIEILEEYKIETRKRLILESSSNYLVQTFDLFFDNYFRTIKEIVKKTGMKYDTAKKQVKKLKELSIISETKSIKNRSKVYVCNKIKDIYTQNNG